MKATITESGPCKWTATITFSCGHTVSLDYSDREAAESDAQRDRPCWICRSDAAVKLAQDAAVERARARRGRA